MVKLGTRRAGNQVQEVLKVAPVVHGQILRLSCAEVRHNRAGGTSAPSNQRKADNKAKANLETAVKTVEREMASGAYMHIYIAGPDEARSTFERMLPERLKKVVVGHLSASLDSSELKRELREKLAAAVAKP